jgi:hypothetical protein
MTVELVAAFHEAGHAIAAHRSKYHAIVGSINLAMYGSGEIYVSLSKSKLRAGGKEVSPASQTDKDVAIDLAIVLSAGLVAERLAAGKVPNIVADPQCAQPDHALLKEQLVGAGLSENFDRYEATALALLEQEWSLLASLAGYLHKNIATASIDVREFIDERSS